MKVSRSHQRRRRALDFYSRRGRSLPPQHHERRRSITGVNQAKILVDN